MRKLGVWVTGQEEHLELSLIHISEPTRRTPISYAVFCLKKKKFRFFFFLMIRRPPRSTPLYSSAASDVYKRQDLTTNAQTWSLGNWAGGTFRTVSYTHLRAHETDSYLVCRLLLEKKKI